LPKGVTNRNPSPATRFKPGQSGNPRGKTGFQREMEIRNAQVATQVRGDFLDALQIMMLENPTKEERARLEIAQRRLAMLSPDTLRLLKDSEERGLGSPQSTAAVQVTNPDGSLKQATARDIALELLSAKHGKPVTV
jgi:hypothetical protein